MFKKTSVHKNLKQLTFDDGFKSDVNFEKNVEEWKPFHTDDEENEADCSSPVGWSESRFLTGT